MAEKYQIAIICYKEIYDKIKKKYLHMVPGDQLVASTSLCVGLLTLMRFSDYEWPSFDDIWSATKAL